MLGTIKRKVMDVLSTLEGIVTPPAAMPARVIASRVVLVGASVSMDWHVEVRYPSVSVKPLYSFDKTPIIDELLGEAMRPDGVILKQCAAYFPEPLEPRKPLVEGWLDRLDHAGIATILATVVPVTSAHDRENPGRLEGIVEYNRWVREVAGDRGLALLDLATALQASRDDPHLDERLATRDGLHLRRVAYRRRLDPILQPALIEAFSGAL